MTKNRTTRVQPTTSQFHVYVMRAEPVDPAITWDVYVGSMGLDLPARWRRYEPIAAFPL